MFLLQTRFCPYGTIEPEPISQNYGKNFIILNRVLHKEDADYDRDYPFYYYYFV